MTDHAASNESGLPTAPAPHPALGALEPLVGTWRLETRDLDGTTTATGTVTRRWLPGGHFLVQEMHMDDEDQVGAEYVGYDHALERLRSMYFSSEGPGPFCSFALEYVWEIEADRLTIWHGDKGSPARFSGTIGSSDIVGRWEWPGGGYEATETRVADEG